MFYSPFHIVSRQAKREDLFLINTLQAARKDEHGDSYYRIVTSFDKD